MSFRSRLLNILFWSVISAAFIDPGTVATAAKAGADFGLPLLWALTFATIACLVLQEASARLTIASGMNLGQAIWQQAVNGRRGNFILVLVALCILSGTAAYQAGNLLGAMAGTSLLIPLPPWLLVLVIGLIGTTVVPYNLFLGSGISTGQSIKQMRSGLVVFISLLIVMAGLIRAVATGMDLDTGDLRMTIPWVAGAAVIIMGIVIFRISLLHK